MKYERLTEKDWHEAKFSRLSKNEPSDREILKRLWDLENKIEQGTLIELKELKKAFWQYIGRHGIVVTNGNIDFVVEDCLKELQE